MLVDRSGYGLRALTEEDTRKNSLPLECHGGGGGCN